MSINQRLEKPVPSMETNEWHKWSTIPFVRFSTNSPKCGGEWTCCVYSFKPHFQAGMFSFLKMFLMFFFKPKTGNSFSTLVRSHLWPGKSPRSRWRDTFQICQHIVEPELGNQCVKPKKNRWKCVQNLKTIVQSDMRSKKTQERKPSAAFRIDR